MGAGGSKSKSKSRTFLSPAQLGVQKDVLGEVGGQARQGFFDFGRQAFGGPIEVAPSSQQVRGLRGLTDVPTGPVDYSGLRAASNASFASRVQNVLGPELRERAGRVAGYGSDYGRLVADPIAEQALNLETFLTGLEANSMEQARNRGVQQQLGLLSNLPAFNEALDPEQSFRQREATAAYEEFLRRLDPSFLQTLISAVPQQAQSVGSSRSGSGQVTGLDKITGSPRG